MKFDYGTVISALRREAQTQAALTPLRNDRCQPLFFCHSQATEYVFLLFHDFTAAPYEFTDISQALFDHGHNVVVPLLPGHGLKGHWNRFTPPPLPLHRRIYEEFALRWFKRSRTLGQKIALGGVGTGATLAAWLASQYPTACDRLVLVNPYLPSTVNDADPVAPYHLFSTPYTDILGETYWEWIVPEQGEVLPGYDGFCPRSLQVWFELATEVSKRSEVSPFPPLLVVGSEWERALRDDRSRLFCEHARRYQPQAWHIYYASVLDVGHPLLIGQRLEEMQPLAQLIQQYATLNMKTLTLAAA